MKAVQVTIHQHANLSDALIDVARAIRQGYGAGTITTPHKNRDYYDEDYLGFWTSSPSPEWSALDDDTDTSYLIESEKEIGDYEMARLVEQFKP